MAQILLVEDDAAASGLIQQYMGALYGEHQLAICSTAAAALNWSNEHPVDLFILDIQLPDYRGTELGKQIRAMPRYRFTPILFTTELAGEELGAYREIKCYDFLVKPFTQKQFTNAASDALDLGKQIASYGIPLYAQIFQRSMRETIPLLREVQGKAIRCCAAPLPAPAVGHAGEPRTGTEAGLAGIGGRRTAPVGAPGAWSA